MKTKLFQLFFLIFFGIQVGCVPQAAVTEAPTATPMALSPTPTLADPTATFTPLPPTKTSSPTDTPVPPSPTSLPPTATPRLPTETPRPATDSVCASGCDFTTLQAAIDHPETAAGAVIEILDPVHTEAGIVVDKDVTIRGLGAAETVIQAHEAPEGAAARVFLISEGAVVVLAQLTIRHGQPASAEECGGGVMNQGTLTLDRTAVESNLANSGGGICNAGDLTLVNSTVRDNTANGLGPVGYTCGTGAGIKCERGKLTLFNSTVSGNTAMDEDPHRDSGRGGGVHIGCKCTGSFTNSTISGNRAIGNGGGIHNHGTLELINCTITDNFTSFEGGGIYVRGHLDYANNIIAGNTGKGGSCVVGGPGGYQGQGTIGWNSNNWVGGGNCDAAYGGIPMLGPLADNGGDTRTHALLPGSPAIDLLDALSCQVPADQRGAPRAVVITSADTPCDLGAYEAQGE